MLITNSLHKRPSVLAICLTLALTPFGVRVHTDESKAPSIFTGCKYRSTEDFYPETLRRKNTVGRVLLVVERTSKGKLEIVEVKKSEPQGVFDKAGKKFLAAFLCTDATDTLKSEVSITFSLSPGPEVPHFEGVETTLGIRAHKILTPKELRQLRRGL